MFPDVLMNDDNTPNPQSLVSISGLAESNLRDAEVGAIIQLERIGFGRIDYISQNQIIINMTEKN